MLNEVRLLDRALKKLPVDPEKLRATFRACNGLDVNQAIEVYRSNQRGGKFNALKKFFQATEFAVGKDTFTNACMQFIAGVPSASHSLTRYNPRFPEFIGQFCADQPHVRDLARFEWLWHRAFYRPYVEDDPFDYNVLREVIASGEAYHLKFRLVESAVVAGFDYNVGTLYRQGRAQEALTPVKTRHWLLLWRPEPLVRKRRPLSLMQARLVNLLGKNLTIGQAMEFCAKAKDPDKMSQFLYSLIQGNVISKVVRAR